LPCALLGVLGRGPPTPLPADRLVLLPLDAFLLLLLLSLFNTLLAGLGLLLVIIKAPALLLGPARRISLDAVRTASNSKKKPPTSS